MAPSPLRFLLSSSPTRTAIASKSASQIASRSARQSSRSCTDLGELQMSGLEVAAAVFGLVVGTIDIIHNAIDIYGAVRDKLGQAAC